MSRRHLVPVGATGVDDFCDRWVNSKSTISLARVSAEPAPRSLVLIENRVLVRDTLANALQFHIKCQVHAFPTIDEWIAADLDGTFHLIVLSELGRSAELMVSSVRTILAHANGTPCAILSDNEEPEAILSVLRSGARGYIPTSLPMGVGIEALALVCAGGIYGPVSMLIENVPLQPRTVEPLMECCEAPQTQFTPRQLDVIESLRRGKPNKLIAYELQMCEGTVKVHIRNIMRKLKATNRTEVAILANQFLK